MQLVRVQLQQSQIRCDQFRRVAISVVSQLQSVRVGLQLVRVGLQLVRQVAIGSAVKLQPQGLCICYTECTWVHFSITLYIYTYIYPGYGITISYPSPTFERCRPSTCLVFFRFFLPRFSHVPLHIVGARKSVAVLFSIRP
jgi:hypothetical protein